MNKQTALICKRCGSVYKKPTIEKIPLVDGGFHDKASCPACGGFIKFLPHTEPALYFGKYKGQTISEIARKDVGYLKWLLAQGVRNVRLKSAIEEAVCKVQK